MKHKPDKLNKINATDGTSKRAVQAKPQTKTIVKKPISMHEDVPVWYDCCSCEAEPYWLQAMDAEDNK